MGTHRWRQDASWCHRTQAARVVDYNRLLQADRVAQAAHRWPQRKTRLRWHHRIDCIPNKPATNTCRVLHRGRPAGRTMHLRPAGRNFLRWSATVITCRRSTNWRTHSSYLEQRGVNAAQTDAPQHRDPTAVEQLWRAAKKEGLSPITGAGNIPSSVRAGATSRWSTCNDCYSTVTDFARLRG
jgi:hypothetical protein